MKEGGREAVERFLHAKFYLSVFTVSAFGGQKTQFLANFDIWGTPVPTPFTDERQIWCARQTISRRGQDCLWKRMTEDRDKWRKYVHMVWPILGSRTAK